MNDDISQFSIQELLSGREDYIIPMYQRNYAWDEGEITQLLQDVIDYMPEGRNYYIGTLVVAKRHNHRDTVYETIDGQQRLTTLSLLVSYLKNNDTDGKFFWYEKLNIQFESREHSRRTLAAIFEGKFQDDPSDVLREKEINTTILNGYRLIKRVLPQRLKENKVATDDFAVYLLGKVRIIRVLVPHDTDLNHYFEIMNSRGEQLEKHEVLKSRLLKVLNGIDDVAERKESQNCLHVIWEACANMEKYIQLGFNPEQRNAIFGKNDWGRFQVDNFDQLRKMLKESEEDDSKQSLTLNEIAESVRGGASESAKRDAKDAESDERFNTVINFPNFLLHVLRVGSREDIPLDDKRLITTFETHLLNCEDAITRAKQFAFNLLRCKYLFDQYVIKREFIKETDRWSLKRFKWNDGSEGIRSGRGYYVNTFGDDDGNGDENRRILLLLSAFHVSTPTLVYKHWLNAALYHLFHAKTIQAKEYLLYLESVAKAFVFDRFLADGGGADYFDMIYRNGGVCQTSSEQVSDRNLGTLLSFGNIENNLVFNFLDYLLWMKYEATDKIIKSYEFTFRSSVEHYYPQNPLPGHDRLPPETLNSFGNLCLISHSKNSRLSNFMPEAKREYYRNNTIDSIKQHLMIKYDHWDTTKIVEHYDAMKNVLVESLKTGRNGEKTSQDNA
jgi:hypothetical protein